MSIFDTENDLLVKIKEEFVEIQEKLPDINYVVKIEKGSQFEISENSDWCVDEKLAHKNTNEEYARVVSYENLIRRHEQRCGYCRRKFENSLTLYMHMLNHIKIVLNSSIYICNDCTACYATEQKLIQHINEIHKQKYIKTEIRPNNKVCNEIKQIINRELVYECGICSEVVQHKMFSDHVKNVHCGSEIKCTKCDVHFKELRTLTRHLLYHNKHSKYKPHWRSLKTVNMETTKCKYCPITFCNSTSYKIHLTTVHSDTRLQCNICHSSLKCKKYLQVHMRRVHYNDGKEHKCDICGKVFKSPRYVSIHKKNSHDRKHKS